jgi:hypothetical protein
MALTRREAIAVRARIEGKGFGASLRIAGFPPAVCHNPDDIWGPEMHAEVARIQARLVAYQLKEALIDAEEIHCYLSDAMRATISDIRNDDGTYKPISEWPEIWQKMAEGGDVDIEYASERSHDGETRDKAGGWDETGKIVKVRHRFASKYKLLELAMKHKGINAMIQPGPAQVTVNNMIQIRWQDDSGQ